MVYTAYHCYNAVKTVLNIANRSTAKTLVGEPLCSDETWLQTSLENTVNTGKISLHLQKYPTLMRPLVYPFTMSRRRLNDGVKTAQGLLSEVIRDRTRGGPNVDILQWLIDSSGEANLNASFLTKQCLFVATASTRSTATSIVHCLFDLIAFPQYQQTIRDEIQLALKESEGWGLSVVQETRKLDSFIKESQRLNHHVLCE